MAISSHFKRKFNVFFDIGDYKSKKYSKITNFVKQAAIEVVEKHNEIKINIKDDLEKKIVFQVLKKFNDIYIENIGFGDNHAILIKYKHNKNNKSEEITNHKSSFFTSINTNNDEKQESNEDQQNQNIDVTKDD